MTNEKLATPPTTLEVAEVLLVLDCQVGEPYLLSRYSVSIIRRLAFDRDRLQDELNRIETAMQQLSQSTQDEIVDKMASDGLRNSYE